MPTQFTFIPPIQNLQPEYIFSRCRFNLLGDANSWLNLLKPNAAIRGWLTVFRTDIKDQERNGQPVAPLIVALARDGRNPRLTAEGSNQTHCNRKEVFCRLAVNNLADAVRTQF